ncbi:MAG: ribonuclease HII [Saprospiraceae bacterium]
MVNYSPLKKYYNKNKLEAGCDEAGRGCLAGPVFAAAVILPQDWSHPLLNDSKLTTHKTREILRPIIEREAISWSVARMTPKEIDKYNILNASLKSMHKAIKKLDVVPDYLLIDGNRFLPYKGIPHECIIKGDGKYTSIAAASILAKIYRDIYMLKQHKKHPFYGWQSNKGYPTQEHRDAIATYGVTKLHRQSFRLHYPSNKNDNSLIFPK